MEIEKIENGVEYNIYKYYGGVSSNESLASSIKDTMKKQLKEDPSSKKYFYVTHITNPAGAYWSITNPKIKYQEEIARKLALGKSLEKFANPWFRNLPEFVVEEGKIDSAWIGKPGVRGSIDYRLGDSIIEFKTKEKLPENVLEIFSIYPQDLEQLAFYSVIHPSSPDENYLVFMKDTHPHELKTFKVKVKDFGALKNLMINRMKTLREAIEKRDPSKLGRCRYFNSGCRFLHNKVCNCEKAEDISTKILERSLVIEEDEDLTKRLESSREFKNDSFFIKDIIAPRKHVMEKVLGKQSLWIPDDEKAAYLACLWSTFQKLNLGVNQKEKNELFKRIGEPRISSAFRFVKIPSSIKPDGEIIPFLLKVSLSNFRNRNNIPDYYKTELGIICANYKITKGLLIMLYPRLNKSVQVFEIKYRNTDDLLKEVKNVVDTLEYSKKEKKIEYLNPCPNYMNDGGKCPLIDECHSENVKGCKL